MKFSITFKTPGVIDDAIDEAARLELDKEEPDEYETGWFKEELQGKFKKWVEYGEFITIDFDLDAMTATVREIGR